MSSEVVLRNFSPAVQRFLLEIIESLVLLKKSLKFSPMKCLPPVRRSSLEWKFSSVLLEWTADLQDRVEWKFSAVLLKWTGRRMTEISPVLVQGALAGRRVEMQMIQVVSSQCLHRHLY